MRILALLLFLHLPLFGGDAPAPAIDKDTQIHLLQLQRDDARTSMALKDLIIQAKDLQARINSDEKEFMDIADKQCSTAKAPHFHLNVDTLVCEKDPVQK